MISIEMTWELYERLVIPIVVYSFRTWSLSAQERKRIKLMVKMGRNEKIKHNIYIQYGH